MTAAAKKLTLATVFMQAGGHMKGREKESSRIRAANKAVAIVRLMDGQIRNWDEFLAPDIVNLESLPRRALKSGRHDVRKRVSNNIKRFCENNFFDMTEDKLVELYEHVKLLRGLEIPLSEFQDNYSRFRVEALSSNPLHSTLRISLWGLRFEYPEKHLADDVESALSAAQQCNAELKQYEAKQHAALVRNKDDIARCVRLANFNSRMAVLSCFNLVEAYLNGLAWEFLQTLDCGSLLSKRQRDLLQDASGTSLRDKILKYPRIIIGKEIFAADQEPAKSFLEVVKPYRDSLVHPSPFSAPQRFGGYDKLRTMYCIDVDTANLAARLSIDIIGTIHKNIACTSVPYPDWLQGLLPLLPIEQA